MESDRLEPEALLSRLRTREIGRAVQCLDEVGSTSDVAFQLATQGAPHGQLVVAERQTKGRGRRGRAWLSPPGSNLYFSLVLRPVLTPARAPELTLVAAVACCEALSAVGVEARIKWPNDLEVGGRKVAGILTEMHAVGRQVEFVVVGIGVDVNMGEEDFPVELRPIATSLRLARGEPVERQGLLVGLLESLERWFVLHAEQGFEPVRSRWTELASTVGARVRVQLMDSTIEGEAVGIDGSGALLVRTESGVEKVLAGDVKTLRPRG